MSEPQDARSAASPSCPSCGSADTIEHPRDGRWDCLSCKTNFRDPSAAQDRVVTRTKGDDRRVWSHAYPRSWRLRWWLARTFKTRDYRYVENEKGLPDEF